MRHLGLLGLFFIACASEPSTEEIGRVPSAIVGGRPSGDDENAAVYIENASAEPPLRCTGRIIAPGLVVTARHCLLNLRSSNVKCTADGAPVDITEATGLVTVPADRFAVSIGPNRASQRTVSVRDVLANVSVTLCRGDIGYLVLAEKGLDLRTPIRRAPPAIGDRISVTGWGFVDDSQRTILPETRSTIETTVKDVGPGRVPAGTFVVPGKTLCVGDSGAAALSNGELLGVYSRIDNPDTCTFELGANVLVSVTSEPELLHQAFAAIGEEPWFAGEQKPWAAAAGATCSAGDHCRGGVCEGGTCKAGCGPTGVACAAGQRCATDAATCEAAPASPDAGGCAVTRSGPAEGAAALLLVLAAVLPRRRSRDLTAG